MKEARRVMRTSKRRVWIGATAALVCVVAGTTAALTAGGASAVVPPGLSAFAAFGQPATSEVPAELRRFVAEPDVAERFGLDGTEVRAIPAPTGSGSSWYLIPGSKGVCFNDGAGGACASIENALGGQLMAVLRPAPIDSKGTPSSNPSTIVEGVVPSNVTAVRVTGSDGATTTAEINAGGAYRVGATGLSRVEFVGTNPPAPIPFRW